MDLDLRGEFYIGGTWVDATGNILKRQALTHTRGRQDQGARVDPSTCRPLLNNTNGQFSPDNPMGPYYGLFGRNTPFRLSVRAGTPALELDGSAANNASTPDVAALDITGDLDLRWEGETDWYAPGSRFLIGKWAESGNRAYALLIQDAALWLRFVTPAGDGLFAFASLPVVPRRAAVRATLDTDNGTGGFTVRLYWADTINGPWTQFGGDLSSTAFGAITLRTTTAPLTIAPSDLVTSTRYPVAGRVYKAEVRNGIDGPLVASPDFTAQAAGTISFADSAGRAWTLSGTANITDRRTRLIHELAAYPTRWHPSGKHVWVEAQTAGILRRLRRSDAALDSTLRRRIPSFNPLAYWPLEEGNAATRAYSPIAGVSPLTLTGVTWASADSLPSSSPLPALNPTSTTPTMMMGRVPAPATALSAWCVMWLYRLDQAPASRFTFMRILSTGTIAEWYIQSGADGTTLIGRDDDGTTLVSHNIGTGTDLFGQWVHVHFAVAQNGPNIDYDIWWTDVGGDAGHFGSSIAGSIGRPTAVASPPNGYAADLQGMAIGHISVWPSLSTEAYVNAVTAWTGEAAGERMHRLAAEENLPVIVQGANGDQQQVGPQLPNAALELLEEAAEADGGVLFEDRERLALRFRDRRSMYNQRPILVLDYNAPGLAPPLEPTGDDDTTQNDVTVTRANGSSGRAVLEEGTLSVLAPPDGVGPYPVSTTLNLHSDEQTEPMAYWRLHLGTYEGRRYPQVRVMAHAAPAELLEQILAADIGDKIVIRNPPPWLAPGDIELIVEGYEETWASEFQWDIVFNCTPGAPWNVAAVSSPAVGRVDANPSGSTLAAATGPADTQLLVHTPSRGSRTPRPWITSLDRLTTNPDFEEGLTGWSATGGTIERVPTPQPAPFGGDWSMQITPNGIATLAYASSAAVPVVPGTTYTVYGWLRCNVARAVDLNINWYDAGGLYLDTDTVNHTVQANEYTEYAGSFVAPAGAATARVLPTLASTPPSTQRLLADVVFIGTPPAGSHAREFPYDVTLGGETVRVTANSPAVRDTFGRIVAGGWGTANTEQTWSTVGNAADFSVGSGYGAVAQPATGIAHLTLVPAPGPDVDLYVDVATSVLAAGSSLFGGPIVRAVDNANWYGARLDFTTTAGIVLTLRKRVANVETQLATVTTGLTHTAGAFYRVRLRAQGSELKAKVWPASDPEPSLWQVQATDTALAAAANLGTRSFANTGSTAVNPQIRFTNFHLVTPQRMTVQRSLNGIVKPHAAGTEVRLAQPAVVAL
ncbi:MULTISPECIES: carbohydrate binding domain-containing protein [unclassified Streptomyces]|uniref:carbohydrate binding domain-containing protein n=1 Tax=unclassified Streptomyces TaxID=2593676 RepID=UPI00339F1900